LIAINEASGWGIPLAGFIWLAGELDAYCITKFGLSSQNEGIRYDEF
jgi:hypothetical protein